MYPRIQPDTAHPDRFPHTQLCINDVVLNDGMQDFMIGRNIDCLCSFDSTVNVCLRDFTVFNFDHALRIKAADVVARNTCGNMSNLGIRHQLGFIDRLPDGLNGGIYIGNHACTQAAGNRLSQTDNVDFVVILDFADQRQDFRCTDIQYADISFLLFHCSCALKTN